MRNEIAVTLAAVALLGSAPGEHPPAGAAPLVVRTKTHSRFVTAEMRANALANARRFDWAAAQQRSAVAGAQDWLAKSDDELWEMVVSQELPRGMYLWQDPECPRCGDGIFRFGVYPWKDAGPWKLSCPNCREVFPKNDFWPYYRSGLDEHGFFRPELADESLLFNAEHPDPKDPLHKLYVDDGYGMIDEKGKRAYGMIAHYNYFHHWQRLLGGMGALAQAYALTSEPKYAHKAAILLDRLADVYPEMDFLACYDLGFEHSHGGGVGRIRTRGIEHGATRQYARAYDLIFDGMDGDAELVRFGSGKARKHGLGDKSSVAVIRKHIEDNLLIEAIDAARAGDATGNAGGRELALLTLAVALDRPGMSEEVIDWVFTSPPGATRQEEEPNLSWILVEGTDRDGMGDESGSYGWSWTRRLLEFPELLAKYPEYRKHDIIREFPKLKQAFLLAPRAMALDAAYPPMGDGGSTGAWHDIGSAAASAKGYRLYKDQRMADDAWRYARGNPAALRLPEDIYEADPDAPAAEIARLAKPLEDFRLESHHLGRFGLAVLQSERREEGRAIWINYSAARGHQHADALNLGLYAKNIDMLPDLGYPEYTGAWPKRLAWTSNTVSHNTLVVNDTRSYNQPGGKIHLFTVQPPLRAIDVSSPDAYAKAPYGAGKPRVETYRRTVALVDISDADSYVLDVFRARGGTHHRLSYHGPAGAAVVEGLTLVKQPTGTLAGLDQEFARLPGDDNIASPGNFWGDTHGLSWLYDVERSPGPVNAPYTVDWKAEDLRGRIAEDEEPHLRLHALTPCDEVALASGDPPQNKPGNPRRLRYLVQSRLGENRESQFVTVLEPYEKTPFIRRVRMLATKHAAAPNSVAAVAVELVNGVTDILINCEAPTRVEVDGGIRFEGVLGLVRLVNGQVKQMRMSQGTLLQCGDVKLVSERAAYEGVVTGVDASDAANNRVLLQPPLPRDAGLVGQRIHFHNDIPIDTTYRIEGVTPEGISTGEITVVRGFKDRSRTEAGYSYLVNPGDRYVVPTHAQLDR